MNNIVTVAVIGAGDRGKDRYGEYILNHSNKIKVIAVAEPNVLKRETFARQHAIESSMQFESWEDLLAQEKMCDGIIITTSDHLHYEPVVRAMEKDYSILLEKPMSNNLEEVVNIGELSKESKSKILVCHVLRYTSFYSRVKKIIMDKTIGELMSIQHNENIGYYHFAHSFVRGNWRNTLESSPLILAKSCHDMDLLVWLVESRASKISSFGHLSHFKSSGAPHGAGTRCLVDCSAKEDCIFDAQKLYYPNLGKWPTTIVSVTQTEEEVTQALIQGPYGRCVYACDNDVVDHQVTTIEFENGVTATFNLSAFTNEVNRTMKIMGTKGEIRTNDAKNEIIVKIFGKDEIRICPDVVAGGHGGGDTGIMDDFVGLLNNNDSELLTSAENSVESHVMSFAAEESRKTAQVIDVQRFWEKIKSNQSKKR